MTTRILTPLLCAWILWGYGDGQHHGGIGISSPRYEAWAAYTMAEGVDPQQAQFACEKARKNWTLPPHYLRSVCLPDTVNPNTR